MFYLLFNTLQDLACFGSCCLAFNGAAKFMVNHVLIQVKRPMSPEHCYLFNLEIRPTTIILNIRLQWTLRLKQLSD